MVKQIYPCLWFDGQAKAAADLYCSAFGNSKIISENPMVVMLEINEKKIMALNGGPQYKINPSISFFVHCISVKEIDELWKKLSDGGKAMMPLNEYPWSKRYGWLQDKFGMTWQLMLNEDAGAKQSLVPSFLFTGDKFGRAEEAIKFYSSLFENSKTQNIQFYPKEDTSAGKVLFSKFYLNNYLLIAMDGPGEHKYTFDEGVSFVVECDTQKEIDYFWDNFTKEGKESMCGWCSDKFGVSWQVIPSILGKLMSDPEKSQRVVQAFLKMKKFDIKKIQEA